MPRKKVVTPAPAKAIQFQAVTKYSLRPGKWLTTTAGECALVEVATYVHDKDTGKWETIVQTLVLPLTEAKFLCGLMRHTSVDAQVNSINGWWNPRKWLEMVSEIMRDPTAFQRMEGGFINKYINIRVDARTGDARVTPGNVLQDEEE